MTQSITNGEPNMAQTETRKPIVSLDLRRDLPKVRRQFKKLLTVLPQKSCKYAAPCVIGAMVPPAKRRLLDEVGAAPSIGSLINQRFVAVPLEQERDFTRLQDAFDPGDQEGFERELARVEAKYLEASLAEKVS